MQVDVSVHLPAENPDTTCDISAARLWNGLCQSWTNGRVRSISQHAGWVWLLLFMRLALLNKLYPKQTVTMTTRDPIPALIVAHLTDSDFMIVISSNFLAAMHGFRDNEVLLSTRYDVIVNYPPGCASSDFWWRILKDGPWLHDSDP